MSTNKKNIFKHFKKTTIKLKHVFSEANRVTDGLVTLGCSLMKDNPYVLFDTPPVLIVLKSMLLRMYVIGVSTPHFISCVIIFGLIALFYIQQKLF